MVADGEGAEGYEGFVKDLLLCHITLFSFLPLLTSHTKSGLFLPELQTPLPLFYFSPTCFHWGLIIWWTE